MVKNKKQKSGEKSETEYNREDKEEREEKDDEIETEVVEKQTLEQEGEVEEIESPNPFRSSDSFVESSPVSRTDVEEFPSPTADNLENIAEESSAPQIETEEPDTNYNEIHNPTEYPSPAESQNRVNRMQGIVETGNVRIATEKAITRRPNRDLREVHFDNELRWHMPQETGDEYITRRPNLAQSNTPDIELDTAENIKRKIREDYEKS